MIRSIGSALAMVAAVGALEACNNDKPNPRGTAKKAPAESPAPAPAPSPEDEPPGPTTPAPPDEPLKAILDKFEMQLFESPSGNAVVEGKLSGAVPLKIRWSSAGEGVTYDLSVDTAAACETAPPTNPGLTELEIILPPMAAGTFYVCLTAKRADAFDRRAQNHGIEIVVPANKVPNAGSVTLTGVPRSFRAGEALEITGSVVDYEDADMDDPVLDLGAENCGFEVVVDETDKMKFTLKNDAMGTDACELNVSIKDAGGACKGCDDITKNIAVVLPLKDLNARTDKGAFDASDAPIFTQLGAKVLFAARTRLLGRELWTTDLTADGTKLLKDTDPGNASGDVRLIAAGATKAYFAAKTVVDGTELWVSDGTADGTKLVKNIGDLWVDGGIGGGIVVGDLLIFAASNGETVEGTELWKSDGTAGGTVMVKDINPGAPSSDPAGFTVMGNDVYFAATTAANGRELWKTDLTAQGANTAEVANIRTAAASSNPDSFIVFSNKLFFAADNNTPVRRPFVYNGTTASEHSTATNPTEFTVAGSTLYFVATAAAQTEIHKSDGTTSAVILSANGLNGATSSNPSRLMAVGTKVVFFANDDVTQNPDIGEELFVTDGTTLSLLKDVKAGNAISSKPTNPSGYVEINGTAYFSARDDQGEELWKTDGTPGGTVRVKDIDGFASDSSPAGFFATDNDKALFIATGPAGREVWISDGSDNGTTVLKDVEIANADGLATGAVGPIGLPNQDGKVIFAGNDGDTGGVELWKSDGTTDGTVLVRNINPDSGVSSNPNQFVAMGSFVYFAATSAAGGAELWKTDGELGGTSQVADLFVGATGSDPQEITEFNGKLYFSAKQADNDGREVWVTDGTAAPERLANLNTSTAAGNVGSVPNGFSVTNNKTALYFFASPTVGDIRLFKSTGAVGNATLVTTVTRNWTSSSSITESGTNAWFVATTAAAGAEMWTTDGGNANTNMKEIRTGAQGSNPQQLTRVEGSVYFTADDGTNGRELWRAKSDQTQPTLIKDFVTGSRSSDPILLSVNSAFLYVAAREADGKWYLFKLQEDPNNAAPAATKISNFGFRHILPVARRTDTKTYFVADDGTNGYEVWATEGNQAGTYLAADTVGGAGGIGGSPSNLFKSGDFLYMRVVSPTNGGELTVLKP